MHRFIISQEADQFSEKMDDVNKMLQDLISKDKEKSTEASQNIEEFIKKQAKEDSDRWDKRESHNCAQFVWLKAQRAITPCQGL